MKDKLQIVSKQQAIKLKEIGFNWCVERCYLDSEDKTFGKNIPCNYNHSGIKIYDGEDEYYSAATISLALKWLRDVRGIHISAEPTYNADGVIYTCRVLYIRNEVVHNIPMRDKSPTNDLIFPTIFDSHEDAESAGLEYVLQNFEWLITF